MTAQIANGGFEIKPRIIFDEKNNRLKDFSIQCLYHAGPILPKGKFKT